MKKLLSTNAAHQRLRILEWLLNKPLTTYQARQELGHNIHTHWTTVETPLGRHRIAEYVLFSGGNNG